MEKGTIESKVFAILEDIFDIEGIELSLDSQSKDIEDWDSIGHIRLMLAIEEEFKTQILAEKAAELNSVQSIVQYLMDALVK
ncbi:MAG: acyl carrier protein [Dehalococcoidia bacterium]|nr:MAG: acyl carrier protein [Dehalococcoidia bacterium]